MVYKSRMIIAMSSQCSTHNLNIPHFLDTKKNGDAHLVWAGPNTSIMNMLLISCFWAAVHMDWLSMALHGSVDYGTKLILFDVSVPWLDLNVRPTYVEILTRLIKTAPSMRCNRPRLVPPFANPFFHVLLFGKLSMFIHLVHNRFWAIVMYTIDVILDNSGLSVFETSRFG